MTTHVRPGDVVRTHVEGVVTRIDNDGGHIVVFGNAPGQDHIEWEFTFHWATEFDLIARADS